MSPWVKWIRENRVHPNEQCRHTFEITRAQCAPCAGYNAECMDYEKNDAADTKHRSELS